MIEWILGGLIAAYCAFVIIRKIRRIRRGQFCDCGCAGCRQNGCAQKGKGLR